MKIRHREDYRKARRAAYPDIGDQLDAMVRLASALASQGIPLPDEVVRWRDQCEAVKRKYPKPK